MNSLQERNKRIKFRFLSNSKIWKKIETLNDFFNILIFKKRANNLKLVGKKNHERKREKNREKQKNNTEKKKMGRSSFGRAV